MKIKIELCVKLDFDNKVNKSNLSAIVITSHHNCQSSNSNKIKNKNLKNNFHRKETATAFLQETPKKPLSIDKEDESAVLFSV